MNIRPHPTRTRTARFHAPRHHLIHSPHPSHKHTDFDLIEYQVENAAFFMSFADWRESIPVMARSTAMPLRRKHDHDGPCLVLADFLDLERYQAFIKAHASRDDFLEIAEPRDDAATLGNIPNQAVRQAILETVFWPDLIILKPHNSLRDLWNLLNSRRDEHTNLPHISALQAFYERRLQFMENHQPWLGSFNVGHTLREMADEHDAHPERHGQEQLQSREEFEQLRSGEKR